MADPRNRHMLGIKRLSFGLSHAAMLLSIICATSLIAFSGRVHAQSQAQIERVRREAERRREDERRRAEERLRQAEEARQRREAQEERNRAIEERRRKIAEEAARRQRGTGLKKADDENTGGTGNERDGQTSDATQVERLSPPTDEQQKASLALIKEVYAEEYAGARTDQLKQALAKKLIEKAKESQDAANHFTLLRVARDVATNGGDWATAFRAIDVASERYQLPSLTMKMSVLSQIAKKARPASSRMETASQLIVLVDDAIAQDQIRTASSALSLALSEARKARHASLVRRITTRQKELEEIAAEFEKAKQAAAILQRDPTNPEANLVVGKYRCLVKGQWEKGIAMLALGTDDALREIATDELKGVTDLKQKVALGDRWWALAEAADGTAKKQLQERAAHWYALALPELAGLTQDKVKLRLHSLAKDRSRALSDRDLKRLLVTNQWKLHFYYAQHRRHYSYEWQFAPDGALTEKGRGRPRNKHWRIQNRTLHVIDQEKQVSRYLYNPDQKRWEWTDNTGDQQNDKFVKVAGAN